MNSIFGVILFVLMFAGIYVGLNLYVAWWLIRHFCCLPGGPAVVRYLFLFLALSLPLTLMWSRNHAGMAVKTAAFISLSWMGIVFLWFCLAVLGDLAEFILSRGFSLGIASQAGWVVLAAAALLSVFSVWDACRPPLLKTVEIPLKNLPRGLDGFSLVQFSDVHLGVTAGAWKIRQTVEVMKRAKPDLIVFTGDMLDPGFSDLDEAESVMESFDARHGKLGIFGNHEHYAGLAKAAECYRRCGIKLLRGGIAELPGGLQVAGIDDIKTTGITREELDNFLSRLDPAKPSILLSHQPLYFDVAVKKGVGLMLSGHTHKGQIFPFSLFVGMAYRYLSGLYENNGHYLYVTTGSGYWGPPMRLLARSEVVNIILRSPSKLAD